MAMTQRLEVYHGGDRAKAGGEKDLEEDSKNKTKRELLQWCRAMRRRRFSRWSSSQQKK